MHVNVAIVGLDRRSASLGLALKRYQNQPRAKHTFTIIGSDRRTHPMKTAEKAGAIDNFHRALLKATDNADLIFINAPASEQEDIYTRLGPKLKPGAVVLDLAELKQPAIELAKAHFPKNIDGAQVAYLVGMTPIVNINGLYAGDFDVEGARADLFDENDIILTPDTQCPSEAITLAEDIAKLIGGKVRFMDPLEHDGLLTVTEQLPALLGTTLFYALQQSEGWTDIRRMINPTLALAFQSMRNQSPTDQISLIRHNRDNLVHHLEALIGVLDQVRDVLAESDEPEQLEAFITRAYSEWEKWDLKRHSGKWDEKQQVETIPGPLGSMSGFLTINRRDDDNENN